MEAVIHQYGAQILSIIGTILGGLILASVAKLLDKSKQDKDEARNLREELRKDKESLRAEINELRNELRDLENHADAQMVEIHRMRIDNTVLMERFLKLNGMYYDATGRRFEDSMLDTPSGRIFLKNLDKHARPED